MATTRLFRLPNAQGGFEGKSAHPNLSIPISLNYYALDKSDFRRDPLGPRSFHLVFLRYSKEPVNDANYYSIVLEGSDLPASPLGNETKPEGATLKAQIQTLIRRYRTYRDEQLKKEDESLDEALGE